MRVAVLGLKEKGSKIAVVRSTDRDNVAGSAMNFPNFLRIEREQRDGSKHYVVHTNDPKFSMELMPDNTAPDKVGRGVMKRLHVPNSWAGDYTKYSKLIGAAQEFFRQSFDDPAPKTETRRLGK